MPRRAQFVNEDCIEYGRNLRLIFQDLATLGLSIAAYGFAQAVGGNGFIAAFSAGLMLGTFARSICTCLYEFADVEGQLLGLLTFTLFGAVMLPNALHKLTPTIMIYVLLSLTVVRMIPTLMSLVGAKLRLDTQLFLGWFGPRGIASILFSLLLLENSGVPYHEEIRVIVVLTVATSVILHGITAYPFAKWYGKRMAICRFRAEAAEHQSVSEMPPKLTN